MPTADDHADRRGDVDQRADGQPPVDDDQNTDHPDHREQGAGGTRDDPAHEVRHRRHVSVDPLDQFAWCVLAMKRMAEAENVSGQPDPDLVGRVPGRDRGHPGHGHVDQLSGDRDDEEKHRQADQLAAGGTGRGLVDDGPHDQRSSQDQS